MDITDTMIPFHCKTSFVTGKSTELVIPFGSTVSDMVRKSGIPADLSDNTRVFIGSTLVPKEQWHLVRPKPDANVYIGLAPTGDVIKAAALIAVSVFAPTVAGAIAPGLSTTSFGFKLLTAGIGLVGSMLVNALFPPPTPSAQSRSPQESPTLTISGQSNQKDQYGPVRRVYGTHKVYPTIAADPYTKTAGIGRQFLYAIYDFGYGPLDVTDIRIGNTPIAQFEGARYIVRNNTNFSLYTNDVNSEAIGVVLDANGESETRTTVNSANGFEIDFTFPQGLVGLNQDGTKASRSVSYRIQYRKEGAGTWLNATNADFYTSGNNVEAGDSTTITLTPAQYTISSSFYDPSASASTANSGTYIGFDTRSSSATISYTSGTPVVGRLLAIAGKTFVIKSFTGSTVTVEGDGDHIPLGSCEASWNTGTLTCPTISSYEAKVRTSAADGQVKITAKRQSAVLASFGVEGLEAATYEVKVTRLSASGGGDFQDSDSVTWSTLKSYKDSSPISVDKSHTFLELRIKATEELSGVVQTLNAICTSKLNVYDGSSWSVQKTSNPAWIFADIITGSAVNKPLGLDRLDTDNLKDWADYCSQEVVAGEGVRYSCNFVVDYNTTAKELLHQVTSAGRATMSVVNGKYGVSIDEEKTVPVQHFTPRNSWGFTSSRTYIDTPQAIKVRFVDPNNSWSVMERIVYNDGFDETNTTEFEEVDAFGCTNSNQAYRYGRYIMASGILRQEKISIATDMENLICTRGDLVRFTHDVMKVGGLPARIKSISGSQVTIDEQWVPGAGTYKYEHRYNGQVNLGNVTSIDSPTEITVDSTTNMQVGDLIVFGLVDEVSIDCLVQAIDPNQDLTADLTLVEYAPGVFTSDTEAIPAYDPQLSSGTIGATIQVSNLSGEERLTFNDDGTANKFIDLEWDEDDFILESDIYLSVDGADPIQVGTTSDFEFTYTVDEDDIDLSHQIWVDAKNVLGYSFGRAASPNVTVTPVGDVTPPADVQNFRMSAIKETIQLDFDRLVDDSLAFYEVRYSPLETGAIWTNAQVLIDRVAKDLTSASVSSRVGTYFIKAVDGSGNYSANAAEARTTIPILTDLNVITTENDFPTWAGAKNSVSAEGNNLVLNTTSVGYETSGWYEYENIVDLGQIYTARISNKIQFTGRSVADLLSNWATLDSVSSLQTFKDNEASVKVYVRSASSLSVLADWTTLSSVDFLAQSTDWTEWRELTTGDYTGRYFQFALELTGNGLTTPVIRSALVEVDMPDRIDSDENITSGTSVYSVDYSPSFQVKPSVQVTMDNAQTGDYFTITNSDRTGFDIQFFNSSDVAVSRQFDWTAKGYGAQATEVI